MTWHPMAALNKLSCHVALQGRKHCIFLDSKGLVCASRQDLQPHKQPFAHDIPHQKTLLDAVLKFKPTALIGVSTMRGAFSAEVIQVKLAHTQVNMQPMSCITGKGHRILDHSHGFWGGHCFLEIQGADLQSISTSFCRQVS